MESPTSNMQTMMAQMGNMMSQMLQEQLGPTLNQMMVHQARVESRLELLEAASRPMSVAGDLGVDRALLDAPDAARAKSEVGAVSGLDHAAEAVHSSSSEVHRLEVESLSARFEALNRESPDPERPETRH